MSVMKVVCRSHLKPGTHEKFQGKSGSLAAISKTQAHAWGAAADDSTDKYDNCDLI